MAYDRIFLALADPTRRTLFEMLAAAPKSVGELSQVVPVSRPAVSQHLKVLNDAGLVTWKQEGRRNIYSVKREGLVEMRSYLDRLWGDVLSSFSDEIDRKKES